MSKAMLIMDMPESCLNCRLFFDDFYTGMCCQGNYRTINDPCPDKNVQEWCPLKELPEKDSKSYYPDEYEDGFVDGYNHCIDEILKEN